MKIATVREQDVGGLKEQLADLKKEQFNLRFQQATGQLEKVSRVREVRRDIARVLTVLKQKTAK
jgi:large subunit ribosomal protein L29